MRIVRLCKAFGQLPMEGGLYAQPYGHILRMEAVLEAMLSVEQAEMKKLDAKRRLDARQQAHKDNGS